MQTALESSCRLVFAKVTVCTVWRENGSLFHVFICLNVKVIVLSVLKESVWRNDI